MIRPSTLWELFEQSYKRQRLRGGSKENPRQYRIQLNHFKRFLGHEPTLDDLADNILADFMDWLLDGRSPATVNKAYSCIAALWRHAADLGLISTRPTIRPMPQPETIPMAWMIDEIRRLLKACQETPGKIEGIPAGDWLEAIHWFWWSTGERCSAAMSVEMNWVNLERGEVHIPAQVRKGRKKPMLYQLLPQAVAAIRKIWSPDRQMLFPWKKSVSMFYKRYTALLKRAGLPTDRKSKPQRMRRSFASYLEAAGGNATEALDHSSRSVTKKSYLDPRITGIKNHAQKLPPLDSPTDPPAAA